MIVSIFHDAQAGFQDLFHLISLFNMLDDGPEGQIVQQGEDDQGHDRCIQDHLLVVRQVLEVIYNDHGNHFRECDAQDRNS